MVRAIRLGVASLLLGPYAVSIFRLLLCILPSVGRICITLNIQVTETGLSASVVGSFPTEDDEVVPIHAFCAPDLLNPC